MVTKCYKHVDLVEPTYAFQEASAWDFGTLCWTCMKLAGLARARVLKPMWKRAFTGLASEHPNLWLSVNSVNLSLSTVHICPLCSWIHRCVPLDASTRECSARVALPMMRRRKKPGQRNTWRTEEQEQDRHIADTKCQCFLLTCEDRRCRKGSREDLTGSPFCPFWRISAVTPCEEDSWKQTYNTWTWTGNMQFSYIFLASRALFWVSLFNTRNHPWLIIISSDSLAW
jgi:hypothetical protein